MSTQESAWWWSWGEGAGLSHYWQHQTWVMLQQVSAECQETQLWLGGPTKEALKLYFLTGFEAALTGQLIERKVAKIFLFSDHFSSTNVKNVLLAAVLNVRICCISSVVGPPSSPEPLQVCGRVVVQISRLFSRLLTGASSQLCLFWWRGARSFGQGGSGWRAAE